MSRRPASFAGGFGLLVLAVLTLGLNQRPAITIIPPIQDTIAADVGIGPALTGALTSVPLACFAVLGLLVPALERRLGVDRLMVVGIVLLVLGSALRPWSGAAVLFAGTVVVGAAITIANVLQPVVVRRDAPPHRIGLLMPLSTAALTAGAALSSLVAVDAERWLGWRTTLALVAVPAVVALVVWLPRARRDPRPSGRRPEGGGAAATGSPAPARAPARGPVQERGGRWRSPWTDGDAWWLAAYFALQSGLFYATAAWLPSVVTDRAGTDRAEGGYALTLFFAVGIVGSLVTPLISRRLGGYRRTAPVSGALWAVTYLGLILAPGVWPLWASIAGIGQGMGIGTAMTLIAGRPVDVSHGRDVSSMVQSAGYTIAALCPMAFGWLFGRTDDWLAPCLLAVGMALVFLLVGVRAGSDRPIGRARGASGDA